MKSSNKNHPRRQKKHNPQQLYGSVNQANTADYYEMKKIRSNSCTSGGLAKHINGSICSSQRSFESEEDWEQMNQQRSAKLMIVDLYHQFRDKLDVSMLKEFDKFEGQGQQQLEQVGEKDLLHNLKQLMEIHFIQKMAEDKQLKEQYENDCANYDKSLQKLEAQVRDHIRIQQELRLLLEQAGQKNIEQSQQMQMESQMFSQQKQLLEQAMSRIAQKDAEINALNHNQMIAETEIIQLNQQLAAKITEISTYQELLGLAATRAISTTQDPQHSGLRNHTEGALIRAAGNEVIPSQANEKSRIQTIILQQKLSSFRNHTKQQGQQQYQQQLQQQQGQKHKEEQNQQQHQGKAMNQQPIKKNNENKNQFEQSKLLQFFKKDRLHSQFTNMAKAEDANNSIREQQINSEVTTMATEGVQSSRRKEVISQKQTRSQSFYGRNGEDKTKNRQSSLKRSSNINSTCNKGDNTGQVNTSLRLKKSNESNPNHKGRANSRDNSFVGVSRSFLDSSVVGEYFSNIKEEKLIFHQGQFLL